MAEAVQLVPAGCHETRLDAVDLETGERRHFRLDRIAHAEVMRAALAGS